MSRLPDIKKKDCTWDALQLYYRRGESKCQTLLSDFTKFSLRLTKQAHSTPNQAQIPSINNYNNYNNNNNTNNNQISQIYGQDVDYWENEFQRRCNELYISLKMLTTIVSLIVVYPNELPGQEFSLDVIYLDPLVDKSSDGSNVGVCYNNQNDYSSKNGQNNFLEFLYAKNKTFSIDPNYLIGKILSIVQRNIENNIEIVNNHGDYDGNNINNNTKNNDNNYNVDKKSHFYSPISLTPTQIAYSRRCLTILNDITVDFNRNRELSSSSLNRMILFAKNDQNDQNDEKNNDDSILNILQSDDYSGDNADDSDADESAMSDVESQLIQHEQAFGHVNYFKNKNKNSHKNNNNNNKNLNSQKKQEKSNNNNNNFGTKILSQEQRLITQSLEQTQDSIRNATSSLDSLDRQRDMFSNIINKVTHVATFFPGMTTAMNAIQNKKNRDNLILATLVAFLLFFTFLYLKWKHA
jgi:hypothetical protein